VQPYELDEKNKWELKEALTQLKKDSELEKPVQVRGVRKDK
jgi:hypothetical protein